MREKTVLGIHVSSGSRNGYGMTAPHFRGVVVFDGGGAMDEVSEDCYRLYRPNCVYEWPPGSGSCLDDIMPGFDQLDISEMEAQAEYWWPIIRQRIDETAAHHGRIDATKPTNEVAGNDPYQLRKLCIYEKRLGELARADGYTITSGNCATDSPHWGEHLWQSIIAPHVVEMWELGHPYCRHAYADKIDGKSRMIYNGKPAGPSSERPFKEIEYFKSEYGYCGPIILGEIGFVSYPGDNHFMQEITAYDEYLRGFQEIGFGAIFEYGNWNDGKANIQTASKPLSDWLKAHPFEKWEPREDQPPMEKHKAIIIKYPQDASLASMRWGVTMAYELRHTITQSHDDTRSLLLAGNSESYVKFSHPDRDAQTIAMVEELGYRWEPLFDDEPEPPPAAKIDLLPYIRGDGRLYEVRNTSGSQERFQTQAKPGIEFWQTKNNHAEQLLSDNAFIYRGWDTSPGNGRYYVQQKDGLNLSEWLPRHMSVGESFTVSLHVQFYNWDCTESDENSGNVTDTRTFIEHLDSWTSPYGITLNDVIVIRWDNGGEYYYYARDFGLVAWGKTHNDPNTPVASAISEIHAPGQRPDNIVDLPGCLT